MCTCGTAEEYGHVPPRENTHVKSLSCSRIHSPSDSCSARKPASHVWRNGSHFLERTPAPLSGMGMSRAAMPAEVARKLSRNLTGREALSQEHAHTTSVLLNPSRASIYTVPLYCSRMLFPACLCSMSLQQSASHQIFTDNNRTGHYQCNHDGRQQPAPSTHIHTAKPDAAMMASSSQHHPHIHTADP